MWINDYLQKKQGVYILPLENSKKENDLMTQMHFSPRTIESFKWSKKADQLQVIWKQSLICFSAFSFQFGSDGCTSEIRLNWTEQMVDGSLTK